MQKAIDVLKQGGIILYPTDTVWGIGCDATNEEAVERINQLKGRDSSKSYIVVLDDDRKLSRIIKEIPDVAWDLFELATKPTTIILSEAYNLATNVLAADGSVGIRIIKQGTCHQLLRTFGKPLVSTSANLSGEPTPLTLSDINPKILEGVDYVVDLPSNEKLTGTPSTIIKLGVRGDYQLIRK